MESFLLAQIIGIIGYAVYASSGYFKHRKNILIIDALGCAICFIHWQLLGDMRLAWSNIIWLYVALLGLLQGQSKFDKPLLSLSFVMVSIMMYFNWENRITDYTILIGNYIAISVKYYTNIIKFRRQSCISFSFVVVHAALAGSIPGTICGLASLFAHAYNYLLLKGYHLKRFVPVLYGSRKKITN